MKLHEEFIPDPLWEGIEAAADGECRYIVVRMIYNHRLTVVRDGWPIALHGWCFKTAPHALAALGAWEPDTQDEPLFWHKRAGEPRLAPHRHHDLDYNRPRCVHGSYLHDRACDIDPFCKEMRQGSQ